MIPSNEATIQAVATQRIVRKVREGGIYILLLATALVSVLTTVGIVGVLTYESIEFFREVSLREFLFTTQWAPELGHKFGVWPLVCGTMLVAGGALLLAIPTGVATGLFMSEYAPPGLRQVAKPILEVLAGIPTVVYGYFALMFITPNVIRPLFPGADVFNAASAAIVVGIMIIPTIASLCDDAFRAVPNTLREGAYALSATKLEVSTRVVLPSALSGVIAAVLLGLARAVGETMAVAIAAGMTPKITANPLTSIQTMTGYIVQVSLGDTPAGSLSYKTIFVVGLTLFLITLTINMVANRVLGRLRERYE